jgi:hypothetical protein
MLLLLLLLLRRWKIKSGDKAEVPRIDTSLPLHIRVRFPKAEHPVAADWTDTVTVGATLHCDRLALNQCK